MQGVIVEGSGATTAEEMQGVVEESGSTTAAAGEMQGVAVVDFATFSNVNMPSASVQEQQTMATQEQTTMATQQQQQGYENGNGQRVQEMEGSQQMQEMEGSQQMQEMEGSQQVQEMEEGDAIETDAAAAETAMQVEGQESGVSFEVGEEDEDMMDALLNSQEF